MSTGKRILVSVFGIIVVGFVVLQVVPAPARDNPPVVSHITWDSAQTESLVREACYDCHSNETQWPWYAQIAPVSWQVASDVQEGREALNFSEASADQINPDELAEEIDDGAMPLAMYRNLHPVANLTDAQKDTLIEGLKASLHGTEADEAGERGDSTGGEAGEADERGGEAGENEGSV